MRVPMSVLSKHTKAYVQELIGGYLRQEGFVNRNQNGVHWYRIVNNEVFQAIFLRPLYWDLPIILELYYCCHPLYIQPEFPQNLKSYTTHRSIEAVRYVNILVKPGDCKPYSPEILVLCPNDPFKGKDMVQECVELLNSVCTAQACYDLHKTDYHNVAREQNWPMDYMFQRRLSVDFIEEAVFYDDHEIYPHCLPWINKEFERYERFQKVRKMNEHEKSIECVLKRLYQMFLNGTREEYLDYLKSRQEENISLIHRKLKL